MGLKAIYTAIEAQLRTIKNVDGSDLYRHFHTWNNQFEDLIGKNNNDISIPFPAVFMQIDIDNIEQQGNNCQLLDCIMKLHIAHWLINAAGGEFEQNWAVFDVADLTFKKIQKFQFDGSGELIRIAQEQDYSHPALYHFIQTYKFNYVDVITDEPIGGIDNDGLLNPLDLILTIDKL